MIFSFFPILFFKLVFTFIKQGYSINKPKKKILKSWCGIGNAFQLEIQLETWKKREWRKLMLEDPKEGRKGPKVTLQSKRTKKGTKDGNQTQYNTEKNWN